MSELNINTVKILSNEEARTNYFSSKQSMLCHNKDFVRMTGSIKGAIFLTQIIYWDNIMWRKKGSGRFYKTDWDWEKELSISRATLKRLRGILKSLGYVSVSRSGNNGINHYSLCWDKVMLDLCNIRDGSYCTIQSQQTQMNHPDMSICTIRIAQNEPSYIIHKNTQKNTQHALPIVSRNEHVIKNVLKFDEDCVKNYTEKFETLWKAAPRQIDKLKAKDSFMTVIKEKLVDFDTLLEAIRDYSEEVKRNNTETRYIKSLSKWLIEQKWTDVLGSKSNSKSDQVDNQAIKEEILQSLVDVVGIGKDVRLKILNAITPAEYKSWFNDCYVQIHENTIVLTFPTKFRQQYAEIHFKHKIEPFLLSIPGFSDKWIYFKVSDRSYQSDEIAA